MKRFVTSLILLLSLTLSSALRANASSQWMWHGAFPWVYSHAESSWWYMKAGTDGKFLAWKQGDEKWYSFDEVSKAWVVLPGQESEAERWAKWESNPGPYGGLEALKKIKDARESNRASLDIGDYDVSDLTPLTVMGHLTELNVGDAKLEDITILGQLTKLTRLVLKDNKRITDFSPLVHLSNLRELDLRYNNLHQLDITPLYQLSNLQVLRVGLLSSTQLSAIKLALPNCEITNTEGKDFTDSFDEASQTWVGLPGQDDAQGGEKEQQVPDAATYTIPDLSLEMLWVKPGTFMMGSPPSEAGRGSDETQHEVTLIKGFYLGKYEVTQAQYEAVMTGNTDGLSATPSNWPNNPNRPVEQVSWYDVQVFLTRLNAAEQAAGRLSTGWSYVLPTESEWEYACRAGTTTAYSWGDTIATSNANYDQSGIGQTRDVGQYAANAWGFHDMHGNVQEWCADWYGDYPAGAVSDPVGPVDGANRVRRGGSWPNTRTSLRSAKRNSRTPGSRFVHYLGFRVGLMEVQNVIGMSTTHTVQGASDLEMIWVDPGTFTMGSPTSEKVTLTQGFHLGKHEVTQSQWEKVMGSNPSRFKGADRPVERVSWTAVTSFCDKLTALERRAGRLPAGMAYQLPTEAQWEYACRAGTETVFSFGNSLTSGQANISGGPGETTDVGKYPANAWGFHDMHGNIWEWTADWYGDYPTGAVTDPVGPAVGSRRVKRGGSYWEEADNARSAHRSWYEPATTGENLGFRLSLRPASQ